jgi:hypothetical protein
MNNTKPNPADMDFSGVAWEKSPFSGGNDNCVEIGVIGNLVAVRDSTRPGQTPLLYTRDEISAFIAGAKAGTFDHLV